jgi:hypothetical protein
MDAILYDLEEDENDPYCNSPLFPLWKYIKVGCKLHFRCFFIKLAAIVIVTFLHTNLPIIYA